MIFFLTLPVRGPFQRKDFKWNKKYGGTGFISEKMEAFYAEFNERAETATSSYSVTGDFLFILCLWLGIIRTSDQGV